MLADSGVPAIAFVILIGMYFLPTIVAVIRKVPNTGSVFIINLFLGWSIVGWVVAMAMAARSVPPPPQQVIVHQYVSPHQPSQPYQAPPSAPPTPPTPPAPPNP